MDICQGIWHAVSEITSDKACEFDMERHWLNSIHR